jgi:hypothetical protein
MGSWSSIIMGLGVLDINLRGKRLTMILAKHQYFINPFDRGAAQHAVNLFTERSNISLGALKAKL